MNAISTLAFVLVHWLFSDIAEPSAVVIYFSPLTTKEDILSTQKQLDDAGYDITISEAAFSKDGFLESYKVAISLQCQGEAYSVSAPVYLKDYLLGVTVIGEDCQHGSYAVVSNKDDITPHFFRNSTPERKMITWDGALTDLDNKRASDYFK